MLSFGVLIFLIALCEGTKPRHLAMLALVPRLPDEAQGDIVCESAMQVAVNNVNNRSDILPGYHLDITYADEGEDLPAETGNAIKNLFYFLENADELRQNSSSISPIVVGTFSPNGCLYIGAFAQHLNMVEIATGCNLPLYTANRKKFPNYYRSAMSEETTMFAVTKFIKEIGKWSHVAIYSTSIVDYDYIMASTAYNTFTQEGIHVVWFNEFPAVDDGFASLKSANVRIIVIFLIQPDLLLATLCQWYSMGIRPESGYIFILRGNTVLDEGMLTVFDKVCSKDIAASQLRSAFFIGAIEFPNTPSDSMSSLGYDIRAFDENYNALVRQQTPVPAYFLKGHSFRTRCHDTMLQAIIALDHAEKSLNADNLSLRDYNSMPEFVGEVVNQSVANVAYTGIRGTGKTAYSERLEFENEPQQVRQWFPGTFGIGKLLYKIYKKNPWPFNSTSFELQRFQDPTWIFFTKPGLPPNDSWGSEISLVNTPFGLWVFVVVFATSLTIVQIGVAIRTFWLLTKNQIISQQMNRLLLILGCLIINVAACCYIHESKDVISSSAKFDRKVTCALRFILTALGFSVLNGTVFFKLFAAFFYCNKNRSGSVFIRLRSMNRTAMSTSHQRTRRNGHRGTPTREIACGMLTASTSSKNNLLRAATTRNQVFNESPQVMNDPLLEKWLEKFIAISVLVFTLINAAILIAWFASDTPSATEVPYSNLPKYNRLSDTFIYEQVSSCTSSGQTSWIGALVALHGFILLLSLFLAYDLRRWKQPSNNDEFRFSTTSDLQNARVAAVNSTVMLAAVVLILFILTVPLVQHEIIALSMLFDSTAMLIVMFLVGSHLKSVANTTTA